MKALFLSSLFLLGACNGMPAQSVGNAAFANKLNGLLDHAIPAVDVAHVDTAAVFLDAREPQEFRVSHIKNARPVGYDDFELASLKDLSKDTAIIVYCSVGYRSQKITGKLIDAGFTNVQNLYGGIFEWVNSGRSVFNDSGTSQRVHTYNKDWSQWLLRGEKVY